MREEERNSNIRSQVDRDTDEKDEREEKNKSNERRNSTETGNIVGKRSCPLFLSLSLSEKERKRKEER